MDDKDGAIHVSTVSVCHPAVDRRRKLGYLLFVVGAVFGMATALSMPKRAMRRS